MTMSKNQLSKNPFLTKFIRNGHKNMSKNKVTIPDNRQKI